MDLLFTIAVGPHQRSHSRVRVPRDSWPHFTVQLLYPGSGRVGFISYQLTTETKPVSETDGG
jgi:hypothetical protein